MTHVKREWRCLQRAWIDTRRWFGLDRSGKAVARWLLSGALAVAATRVAAGAEGAWIEAAKIALAAIAALLIVPVVALVRAPLVTRREAIARVAELESAPSARATELRSIAERVNRFLSTHRIPTNPVTEELLSEIVPRLEACLGPVETDVLLRRVRLPRDTSERVTNFFQEDRNGASALVVELLRIANEAVPA